MSRYDLTFDVSTDRYGDITLQPVSPGFSSDDICMGPDEAATLAGQLLGHLLKCHSTNGEMIVNLIIKGVMAA